MIERHGFHPAKSLDKGVNGEERRQYRIRFEKALTGTLLCALVLFVVFKRLDKKTIVPVYRFSNALILSDLPPNTSQGGMPRPPKLPQTPVASEEEYLEDDVTIDLIDFNDIEGMFEFDGFDGANGDNSGGAAGPRPFQEVIPEYPEDLRKQGVTGLITLSILVNSTGQVDSVVVIGNTTKNRRLAQAAVSAAYKTTYMPFKTSGNAQSFWIMRPTRFEGK